MFALLCFIINIERFYKPLQENNIKKRNSTFCVVNKTIEMQNNDIPWFFFLEYLFVVQ